MELSEKIGYIYLLFETEDIYLYLMIGKILGFWLVNWHVIWSCINRSESCINLLVFVCMYVCSFLLPVQRSRRQSWDKFVINCFGVWYNLYLAIRRLYHPRLRLGWYSHLIARYKLYHTPKQLITNIVYHITLSSFEIGKRISTKLHSEKRLGLQNLHREM